MLILWVVSFVLSIVVVCTSHYFILKRRLLLALKVTFLTYYGNILLTFIMFALGPISLLILVIGTMQIHSSEENKEECRKLILKKVSQEME